MRMLQTHAPAIFLVIVFLYDVVSTVQTNTTCMRFDPPSRTFSNRFVFDENAQRISVEGRPRRIKM